MNLPRLRDVQNSNVFGTLLTGLVQFMGRSIVLNYPLSTYNNSGITGSKNILSNFGSGSAYGKYTYGVVLRAKIKLIIQNLEASAVRTGLVLVPPLQSIANNVSVDHSGVYISQTFLAKAGSAGDTKQLVFIADLPKLYSMSDDQFMTLPALWFSNGGVPSTVAYAYHQSCKTDGTAFTVGLNIVCEISYEIQPTAININLTE